ncbi:MAG: SpoIID/LytB domain-containing protein [Fidelibacterota bacterium]
MLIKGQVPNKEPVVSIGLVLPADQIQVLSIQDIKNNLSLEIDLQTENKILPASLYKLPSIRAGRGFHWEKQISITVEGELEIKVVDDCLFLINHIPLEKYLMCVATSEISGECPPALLESQTVAARSWLLAAAEQKHTNLGIDACNDDCCQRYQGMGNLTDAAISAAKKTWGQVLIHEEKICDTRYAKSCGGISENNENVWGDEAKPYLRAIHDGKDASIPNLKSESKLKKWMIEIPNSYCSPDFVRETQLQKYLGHVDKSGSYFRWNVSFSQGDLTKLISEKTGRNFDSIQSLQPLNRGISGRITQLRIDGIYKNENSHIILKSEYEIRRVLHPNFLFSSAFIIEANSTANSLASRFIFKGAGWGHGVGLCQIGALGMALNGQSTTDILSHYFQSTELRKIYS